MKFYFVFYIFCLNKYLDVHLKIHTEQTSFKSVLSNTKKKTFDWFRLQLEKMRRLRTHSTDNNSTSSEGSARPSNSAERQQRCTATKKSETAVFILSWNDDAVTAILPHITERSDWLRGGDLTIKNFKDDLIRKCATVDSTTYGMFGNNVIETREVVDYLRVKDNFVMMCFDPMLIKAYAAAARNAWVPPLAQILLLIDTSSTIQAGIVATVSAHGVQAFN
jgi:hypothetical protein